MADLREQWEATPLWQKIVLVFAFPTIVAGAIWFYIIKPDLERKEKLLEEKKNIKMEIQNYRNLLKPQVLKNLEKKISQLEERLEEKKKELEKVVGTIPTVKDLDRIFGKINSLAFESGVIIGKVKLSDPIERRFTLSEKNGRKVVQEVKAQPAPQVQRGRRGVRTQKVTGTPLTVITVELRVLGTTEKISRFLESLYREGIVSYPKSLSIKPDRERGVLTADLTIDVILQK